MVDVASETGLFTVERTWSTSTVDYDNDGREDVWLGFHQHVDSQLMHNNGDGTYTWVARESWKRATAHGAIDRHDCAWADFDGNGLVDAACSVGRDRPNHVKTEPDDNELWLQLTPGKFTDLGTQWGIGDPCGRGRYVVPADFNNDGLTDIFMGNDSPRGTAGDPCEAPGNPYPNEESKVYINHGDHFLYDPLWGVTKPATGIGCAISLDYDKDGLIDLLACNYRGNRPQLYHNIGGTHFVDVAAILGYTELTDAKLGDINGDRIDDLVMSDRTGFLYRLGTPTGMGRAVRLYSTNQTGIFGWNVAIGDLNGDGRQDIYGQIHNINLTTNPNDVLFMNEAGLTFTRLTPPAATGNADSVHTLHRFPGAPKIEFLVMNGKEKMAGPVQVIRMGAS